MSTEKMREEFEAAWADVMRGDDPPPGRKPLRSQIEPDRYRGDAVNFAWIWWQRSRASLVIELPKPWQTNVGAMMTPNGVKFAIESAGLKFVVNP